jgi:hypothetical protein
MKAIWQTSQKDEEWKDNQWSTYCK